MKKSFSVLIVILMVSLITVGFNFQPVSAITATTVNDLSKTAKYFGNLKLVNDPSRNYNYYVPSGLAPFAYNNYSVKYLKAEPSTDSRLSLMYTNSTLYSQQDFVNMPFEANFAPGDSLDKWVTRLFEGMAKYYGEGFHFEIIEKQSNMYIVKYYYGEFYDTPAYTFYKISNGVPLTMTINASGNYTKDINGILSEGKVLFSSYDAIKSYADNPNIGFYIVCIGSFKDKTNAVNLEKEARAKGLPTNMTVYNGFNRVNVGSFRIKSNAEAYQKTLSQKGFNSFLYYEVK